MSNIVGILNYGVAGNIRSIQRALEKTGAEILQVLAPSDFNRIDRLVIPGVGSFPDAMEELNNAKLIEPLKEFAVAKPVLGICIGMQILSRVGFEFGKNEGLGLIEAEVKPILSELPVPHMGFNSIAVQQDNPLLAGLGDASFYFMHSYEVVSYRNVLALTSYGSHEFVSAVVKDNIYGVQFHPEKSREEGIQLFKNFINI